jgi:DNA invertase Pin-like site-specific DNA recombinase
MDTPQATAAPASVRAETRRAVVYARVSTARQAEADLSIPDQLRHAEDYCAQHGWQLVRRFVEPGASGTDERRPVLQQMMEAATAKPRDFDLILVHSMSRFFRQQFQSEFHLRRLRKAGVELISMTQAFSDDPTGHLIRQVLGSFDEYQSRETGKHTLRAMRENAVQAFFNGSRTPFGYRSVEAERRGTKIKKRLEIDDTEAAVVRRIYDAALGRDGLTLGVKAIVNRLNGDGERFRGKPFHISNVHRILTSLTYTGVAIFRACCRIARQICASLT